MSKPSIPVIKFLFKEDHKVLGEALNIQPGFEVEEFADSNELSSYLSTVPAGLVVTSLKDRSDLIQIATFMKIGKKIAKDTAIKVVVFNFSKDRNFEKAIAKLGILDLVEPGINTKALKFKMDFWMKSLNAQMKSTAASNPQKVKSIDQNSNQEKKSGESQGLTWAEPLELEDDIWLLKHENDCKKVLSKWLVRLMGPSPYVGTWAEVKPGLWRFDIKESEKEMFVSSGGAWFFAGDQKPDFVWKENIWLISGDSFDLYFKNGNTIHSRLSCKNRSVTISKNSMFARTKEQIIVESFDKELVFKREVEKLKGMEGENSIETIDSGNLEGKNQTDEINGDPLKGKTKTGADKSGNLSGKTKGGEAIEHENLEQKTSTGKEKTHWANKNKYEEEEGKGPLSVDVDKHKEGSNLEREMKDNEHKKYYKNHNEAEKYEAGELGGNLNGKSSTEEVQKHYDNKKKGQPPAEKEEDDLSGKSETDKLKSHYGQKEKTEGSGKEKEARDLDGKSSTDKLSSHYGRGEKDEASGDPREREKKQKEELTAKERPDKESTEKKSGGDQEDERKKKEEREAKESSPRDKQEKGQGTLKEREKQEQEEKIAKERSERNKEEKELSERELKNKKEAQEQGEFERSGREKDDSKARKNEAQEEEEGPTKTGVKKGWEAEHDFGFKGDGATDKINGHYKSSRPEQEKKSRDKDDDGEEDRPKAEVVAINKAREEKNLQKNEEEKKLDALIQDARVISIMNHKGKRTQCGLDDFFDETIVFHTNEGEIEVSAEVNLDMKFKFLEKDTQLKIDGNVVMVEGDGEGSHFITIQLTKENALAFDSFMKLFELRQKNVTEFLKRAKGA
ncbi:MAG: hypothetical protein ACLGHN_04550 [Bacteriovoracia bacterium]